MPSTAYLEFHANLTDVNRLIALHRQESGAGRGRRGPGHITRGALVLLCAAWERYVETVISEGAHFLTSRLTFASLPAGVQQRVIRYANKPTNAWTAADLATPLWTVIYLDAISARTAKLNTPKHENLQPLYNDFLGVADIGNAWTVGAAGIDGIVEARGDVAHQGGQSPYVRLARLVEAKDVVEEAARETDRFLSDHIRLLVNPPRRPWNRP